MRASLVCDQRDLGARLLEPFLRAVTPSVSHFLEEVPYVDNSELSRCEDEVTSTRRHSTTVASRMRDRRRSVWPDTSNPSQLRRRSAKPEPKNDHPGMRRNFAEDIRLFVVPPLVQRVRRMTRLR